MTCNKLIAVDAREKQYRCGLMQGHDGCHTTMAHVRLSLTIMVACVSCKIVYYRDKQFPKHLNCVNCSGKLDVLASQLGGSSQSTFDVGENL